MTDLGGQDLRPARNAPAMRGVQNPEAGESRALETRIWRAELSRVIESEILPRLLLSHDCVARPDPSAPPPEPPDLAIAEFAQRLIGAEPGPAWEFIDAVRRMGRPAAELFLEVLTPTARHLGKLWETDHCDFVEVTIGLRRLQDILLRLSPEDESACARIEEAPRALLLPTPGKSHVFGISMVETFFRAAGWRVHRGGSEFAKDLADNWFDLVGFSLSGERHIEALAEAVRAARAASRNPSLFVLVGGPLFHANDPLVLRVGADATAADAPSAVQLARSLLRGGAPV